MYNGNDGYVLIFVECMHGTVSPAIVLPLHEQNVRLYCYCLFEFEGIVIIIVRCIKFEVVINLVVTCCPYAI